MSTKIYNGYRMNYLGTYELNNFYLELRGMYKEYCKGRYKTLAANLVNDLVQAYSIREYCLRNALSTYGSDSEEFKQQLTYIENLLKETYNSSQYITCIIHDALRSEHKERSADEIRKNFSYTHSGKLLYLAKDIIEHNCAAIKATNECNYAYDFEGEFCIIPKAGFTDDKIMLLAYGDIFSDYLRKITGTENTEEEKAFVEKYELEYYYYQNSTDEPDDISEEDWENRKKDWDLACGKGAPVENGFSLPMLTINELWSFAFGLNDQKDEIAKDIFSREEAISRATAYIVQDEFVNKLLRNSDDPDKNSYSFILELYDQFKKWKAENPELYAEECNKKKELLMQLPVPEKDKALDVMLLDLIPTYNEYSGIVFEIC